MQYTEIHLRYFHPSLNIGMAGVKNGWLLSSKPVQLVPTVHRGALVCRLPNSRKRISYKLLKQGLVKKSAVIKQPLYLLPF